MLIRNVFSDICDKKKKEKEMISFETSTVHNERGYCEAGHEISFVS